MDLSQECFQSLRFAGGLGHTHKKLLEELPPPAGGHVVSNTLDPFKTSRPVERGFKRLQQDPPTRGVQDLHQDRLAIELSRQMLVGFSTSLFVDGAIGGPPMSVLEPLGNRPTGNGLHTWGHVGDVTLPVLGVEEKVRVCLHQQLQALMDTEEFLRNLPLFSGCTDHHPQDGVQGHRRKQDKNPTLEDFQAVEKGRILPRNRLDRMPGNPYVRAR
ncbi:hypothetical protein HRbin09_01468 [bacterium HR09]|nr:hypothetical protein HRbin09_01468 [bacterium HR09]